MAGKMNSPLRNGTSAFDIPEKGVLKEIGPEDPLRYYYWPVVGRLYRARLAQALSLLSPPYSSILELGYGSGILIPALAARGAEVHGIDRDADPEEVARTLRPFGVAATLSKQDVRALAYPDCRFDLVVAISIMEHVREVTTVLREVHRVLKPRGQFLVGMPRTGALMALLFRCIGWREATEIHVMDHRTLEAHAADYFSTVRERHLPALFPRRAGLYFNMLFRKA